MKIPVALVTSAVVMVGGGCGGRQQIPEETGRESPAPRLPPPSRLSGVFVLESSGVAPEDTVAKVPVEKGRVIMVRRGPPDNSLFARIDVPTKVLPGNPGDSAEITVRPRPGIYGVDLEFQADSATRMTLTFSYALSFVAPAGARERYGSDLEFEKVLLIARLEPDGVVRFLPTTSPGADLVTATVTAPGRYLVAAPR